MNLEELKFLAAKLPPPPPRIWPSEWVPRGTAFEMDMPVMMAAPKFGPGGSLIFPTERVLICNADDYREAVARVRG
jgi:hypothetical protein